MMEAYNHHNVELDVNRMFDQYLYKGLEDSAVDVSLSVPQYNSPQTMTMLHPQQQQQQPQSQQQQQQSGLSNGSHHAYDQTFHTSSYGDDGFDISSLNPAGPQATQQQQQQSQMSHAHVGAHMNTYQMPQPHYNNQWQAQQQQQHHQQSHMTHSQNYQMQQQQQQHQQMMMMHPPPQQSPQMQPQMSPQMQISNHSNFIGRSPPQQQQQQGLGSLPAQQMTTTAGGGSVGGAGGPVGSDDSDDNGLINPLKRQSPELSGDSNSSPTGVGGSGSYMKSGPAAGGGPANKKPKVQKKKKKRDPNEPQKPVSAYALFFRDTQAAIKGQNPNASFGEVSKIVASMWDVLATEHKNVYKKKTEAAKKEYLKALAAYRASLVSKGSDTSESPAPIYASSPAHPATGQMQSPPAPPPQHSHSPGQPVQGQQQQQQQQQPQHQFRGDYYQPPQHHPPMHGFGANSFPTNAANPGESYNWNHQGYSAGQYDHQQPENSNGGQTQQQQMNGGGQQMMMLNAGAHQNPLTPLPSGGGGGGGAQMPAQMLEQPPTGPTMCIRAGCQNIAVSSTDWEDEYCCNDCVVTHCRDVFGNWVQGNNGQSNNVYPSAVK